MGFLDSIFGIDILGTKKPSYLDDAVILAALEDEECQDLYQSNGFTEEDEAIASGAVDEILDF